MNLEIAEAIVEALENRGRDASVIEDYSGRFMYGKTAVAVSGEFTMLDFASAWIDAARERDDLAWDDLDPAALRSDQLGLGIVIY